MGRKLSHEEFIIRVQKKNEHVRRGEIEIRGKYNGIKEPIECYCPQHDYEWPSTPASLYQGSGCPLCGRMVDTKGYKMSNEEFLEKLYETNDDFRRGIFKVVGTYNGSSNPVDCYCSIHNHTWSPVPSNLYKGYGCPICGIEKSANSQKISHDVFMSRVVENNEQVRNGTLEIRGKYEGVDIPIECYCTIHNAVVYPTPYSLEQGHGCTYCAGHRVLKGFNDLATTDPQIAALLTNPEDGHTVARMSHKKKNFTCPLCGKKQDKHVFNVVRRGLQCDNCSDHISYPNRFGRAFLDQLPIDDYTPEYSPDWLRPYLFDLFFEYNGMALAIEMDGGLHHGNKQWGPGNKKDIEGKERDLLKDKLAAENDVEVIRIDAQESSSEYISKHILQSKLNQIFDLSVIDWVKCDMDAQRNLVKEVCDIYQTQTKNLQEIADIVKLGTQCVRNYLKRGAQFGWCDYNPKDMHKTRKKNNKSREINLTRVSDGEVFTFKSVKECERSLPVMFNIKISYSMLFRHCHDKQPYKGFIFNLTDETIQN